MERIKAVILEADPANQGHPAAIGHVALVDADTGEPITPTRSVALHFPFDAGPGLLSANVELMLCAVESVPAAEWNRRFPGIPVERLVGRNG